MSANILIPSNDPTSPEFSFVVSKAGAGLAVDLILIGGGGGGSSFNYQINPGDFGGAGGGGASGLYRAHSLSLDVEGVYSFNIGNYGRQFSNVDKFEATTTRFFNSLVELYNASHGQNGSVRSPTGPVGETGGINDDFSEGTIGSFDVGGGGAGAFSGGEDAIIVGTLAGGDGGVGFILPWPSSYVGNVCGGGGGGSNGDFNGLGQYGGGDGGDVLVSAQPASTYGSGGGGGGDNVDPVGGQGYQGIALLRHSGTPLFFGDCDIIEEGGYTYYVVTDTSRLVLLVPRFRLQIPLESQVYFTPDDEEEIDAVDVAVANTSDQVLNNVLYLEQNGYAISSYDWFIEEHLPTFTSFGYLREPTPDPAQYTNVWFAFNITQAGTINIGYTLEFLGTGTDCRCEFGAYLFPPDLVIPSEPEDFFTDQSDYGDYFLENVQSLTIPYPGVWYVKISCGCGPAGEGSATLFGANNAVTIIQNTARGVHNPLPVAVKYSENNHNVGLLPLT